MNNKYVVTTLIILFSYFLLKIIFNNTVLEGNENQETDPSPSPSPSLSPSPNPRQTRDSCESCILTSNVVGDQLTAPCNGAKRQQFNQLISSSGCLYPCTTSGGGSNEDQEWINEITTNIGCGTIEQNIKHQSQILLFDGTLTELLAFNNIDKLIFISTSYFYNFHQLSSLFLMS